MTDFDFKGLASFLLSRSGELIPRWLPGGRMRGQEYVCGSISGGAGDSFSVNMKTGAWADFADQSMRGGDLISLYAHSQHIGNGESAKKLSEDYNYSPMSQVRPLPSSKKTEIDVVIPAPEGSPDPVMCHYKYGNPSRTWCYKDERGNPINYIARYDPPGEKKQIVPWSWCPKKGKFVPKGLVAPRPLYGLDLLFSDPDKAVMIVEGEKACDAARQIAGNVYAVVTWQNGSSAVSKADWSVLKGRSKILIWPDADPAGIGAANDISLVLGKLRCKEIKIVDPKGMPDKWDAADARNEGMNWEKFKEWVKPRLKVFAPFAVAEVLPPEKKRHDVNINVEIGDQEQGLPMSAYAAWDTMGIAMSRNGTPISNVDNALRVLQGWPGFKEIIWLDEFHQKCFTTWRSKQVREWRDIDTLSLTAYIQRDLGMTKTSDDMVFKAIQIHAHNNSKNEPLDWMKSLKWDGVPRLDSLLANYFGASNTEYARCAGKNWFISMVARVYHPGCKVDNMIVLEGAQGKLKSTALGAIGESWYTEAHGNIDSKDFYMVLQGKIIVEIAELDSFSKAEINTTKKMITCRVDRFRAPYGRTAEDFPRQCVFVGTTNEHQYLRDTTGLRRFWPVKTGELKIPELMVDREQLFAEAVERYNSGESWWEMPLDETQEQQESRRQTDAWEESVQSYVAGMEETTTEDVALNALGIRLQDFDHRMASRIGKILKMIGYENHVVRKDGVILRKWKKLEKGDPK